MTVDVTVIYSYHQISIMDDPTTMTVPMTSNNSKSTGIYHTSSVQQQQEPLDRGLVELPERLETCLRGPLIHSSNASVSGQEQHEEMMCLAVYGSHSTGGSEQGSRSYSMATGCRGGGNVVLWDLETRGVSRVLCSGVDGDVWDVLWSGDGRYLVSLQGGDGGWMVVVWDMVEMKEVCRGRGVGGGDGSLGLSLWSPGGEDVLGKMGVGDGEKVVVGYVVGGSGVEPVCSVVCVGAVDVGMGVEANSRGRGRRGRGRVDQGQEHVQKTLDMYDGFSLSEKATKMTIKSALLRDISVVNAMYEGDPSDGAHLVASSLPSSPDGRHYMAIYHASRLNLLDGKDLNLIDTMHFSDLAAGGQASHITFSSDASHIAITYPCGYVYVIEVSSQQIVDDVMGNSRCSLSMKISARFDFEGNGDSKQDGRKHSWITSRFSPDGAHLFTSIRLEDSNHNIITWNHVEGQSENLLQGPGGPIIAMDCLPDMRPMQIFALSSDGCIYVWSSIVSQQWCVFHPEFETLERNRVYVEEETEFDLPEMPSSKHKEELYVVKDFHEDVNIMI